MIWGSTPAGCAPRYSARRRWWRRSGWIRSSSRTRCSRWVTRRGIPRSAADGSRSTSLSSTGAERLSELASHQGLGRSLLQFWRAAYGMLHKDREGIIAGVGRSERGNVGLEKRQLLRGLVGGPGSGALGHGRRLAGPVARSDVAACDRALGAPLAPALLRAGGCSRMEGLPKSQVFRVDRPARDRLGWIRARNPTVHRSVRLRQPYGGDTAPEDPAVVRHRPGPHPAAGAPALGLLAELRSGGVGGVPDLLRRPRRTFRGSRERPG